MKKQINIIKINSPILNNYEKLFDYIFFLKLKYYLKKNIC